MICSFEFGAAMAVPVVPTRAMDLTVSVAVTERKKGERDD
jgi:hypothetical protein